MTKPELRRYAGLIPGIPAKHNIFGAKNEHTRDPA
jgi:hypothetical protein